jgi:hypothetical protein
LTLTYEDVARVRWQTKAGYLIDAAEHDGLGRYEDLKLSRVNGANADRGRRSWRVVEAFKLLTGKGQAPPSA